MILLTKFAEQRNEKPDTIRKYINRHKEEFEGHFEVDGHKMTLDVIAVKMLDEKYPLPKPVEIINGVDPDEHIQILNDLNNAKSKIEELYDQLNRYKEYNMQLVLEKGELETEKFLLEEKKNLEIQQKELENQSLRQVQDAQNVKIGNLNEELDSVTAAKQELENELKRLKSRNLLERIFKKGE